VQLGPVKVQATASGDRLTLIDNTGKTIVVDDDAYNYAASSYPAATGETAVTCFSTLTGVMSLNIFDNQRRLMPRAETDLVVGAGCN